MKKVAITGPRRAARVDAPNPRPKGDWALVKVYAAPMCAEYKQFVAGKKSAFLGHEAAGEVVEVARECEVAPGERVVVMPQYPCGRCAYCRAGDYIYCRDNVDFEAYTGSREGRATMAQYLLKPAWLLPRIPEGVSYERASLACCGLGPSMGAFETMGLGPFHTLLVTGAGPVGLGAVVNARFRGARVIVVESEPWRVERARAMGAAHVFTPDEGEVLRNIMGATDGAGVDRAIECSGSVRAQRLCLEAVRPKGIVAVVGECFDDLTIRTSPDLLRRGVAVLGSWHYNLNDAAKVMQVIRESPLIDLLMSHVISMSRVQEAFELSASRACAKIILKPWE